MNPYFGKVCLQHREVVGVWEASSKSPPVALNFKIDPVNHHRVHTTCLLILTNPKQQPAVARFLDEFQHVLTLAIVRQEGRELKRCVRLTWQWLALGLRAGRYGEVQH